MVPSDVPRRRNGLSAPYSAPQIVSWLFLAATAIHFLLFISPILPVAASVILTLLFFVLVGLVLYFGLRAIAIDSMDLCLKKCLCEQRDGQIKPESKFLDRVYARLNGDVASSKGEKVPDTEETKQCWICDTQVAEHSMHCKYCNKCVSQFDHHCLWLNTCIGEKNYADFFRVMLAISVMQIVHVIISLALVIDIFVGGSTEERADKWLGASNASAGVAAVLLFFIICDIVSLVLLAQLITFHIHLQKEGLTTYKYIVQDGQRRREKNKLLMELHEQRVSELARAHDEGRKWYALRLRAGEKFRQWGCGRLDPLVMPEPVPEPDIEQNGFAVALGTTGSTSPTTNATSTFTPDNFAESGDANGETQENGEPNQGSPALGRTQSEQSNESEAQADEKLNGVQNGEADMQDENSVSFLPVGLTTNNGRGLMSSERHELDSQPSMSEGGGDQDLDGMDAGNYNVGGGLATDTESEGEPDQLDEGNDDENDEGDIGVANSAEQPQMESPDSEKASSETKETSEEVEKPSPGPSHRVDTGPAEAAAPDGEPGAVADPTEKP